MTVLATPTARPRRTRTDEPVAYADLDPQYEQRLTALLANTRYSAPQTDEPYPVYCNADAWPSPYAVDCDPDLTRLLTDLALRT